MRLNRLAIALLCGGLTVAPMVAPAFAQGTAAPAPTKPAVPTTAAPAASTPAPSASTAPSSTLTNINTASARDLDKLPLIGKGRAASIIRNRPYKSSDELVTKKAISQRVYDKIKDKITTG